MGYKLIMNEYLTKTFSYEAELTEEQYLNYLDDPDHFILYSKMDLDWNMVTTDEKLDLNFNGEECKTLTTTFTSSIS